MKCEECGRNRIGIPCPDNKEGCLVLHLSPCECSSKTTYKSEDKNGS